VIFSNPAGKQIFDDDLVSPVIWWWDL